MILDDIGWHSIKIGFKHVHDLLGHWGDPFLAGLGKGLQVLSETDPL